MRLLPQGLLESAARNPDGRAIERGDTAVTYGKLADGACALAGFLRGEGVKLGDRIALLFESGPDYARACYGIWLAGAAVLGLNAAARAGELARIIDHSCCRAVVMDGAHPEASALAALLPRDILVVSQGKVPFDGRIVPLDEAFTAAASSPPDIHLDPQQLASLIYTSGTTGAPKAVMLSHANLAANAAGIIEYLELTANDSIVCVLPFHYSYGASVLNTHLLAGGRLVIEPNLVFPHRVVETIAARRATGFAGVPSTFALLTSRVPMEKYDLGSVRYVTQAGGAMSPALADRVRASFPGSRLYVMYGQTEATARITWLPPQRLDDKRGSVGIPLRDVEIEIRDEDGGKVSCGVSGEVWVRGPNVMLGYWKDSQATSRVLHDGWLRTGDQGHMDADGYLFIDGRRSDIIKVGAHRVHPLDVEQVIEQIPGVAEVAVVAEEDAVLGQVIKACVVRSGADGPGVDTIKAFCRERLASYKIPKMVEFHSSLPKTASGKLQRHLVNSNASGTNAERSP